MAAVEHAAGQRDDDAARAPWPAALRCAQLEHEDERGDEQRRAEPERQAAADEQQRVDEEHRRREREARRRRVVGVVGLGRVPADALRARATSAAREERRRARRAQRRRCRATSPGAVYSVRALLLIRSIATSSTATTAPSAIQTPPRRSCRGDESTRGGHAKSVDDAPARCARRPATRGLRARDAERVRRDFRLAAVERLPRVDLHRRASRPSARRRRRGANCAPRLVAYSLSAFGVADAARPRSSRRWRSLPAARPSG